MKQTREVSFQRNFAAQLHTLVDTKVVAWVILLQIRSHYRVMAFHWRLAGHAQDVGENGEALVILLQLRLHCKFTASQLYLFWQAQAVTEPAMDIEPVILLQLISHEYVLVFQTNLSLQLQEEFVSAVVA